jgi:bacterial leucyl aminopeptidase
MSMKTRKIVKYSAFIFALTSILFSCNKEDDKVIDRPDPVIQDFVDEVNADSIKKYVQWLQDMGTRFALADDRKEVALKIKNRFIQLGYANTYLDSFLLNSNYNNTNYVTWQYNVVATINGTVWPDSVCIIGAHYDCITRLPNNSFIYAPGANDNASGVGATLETARVIKKNNFSPRTSIQFIAFCAEELGLLGSNNYANKIYGTGKRVRMMLNNDMVAYWPVNQNNMRVNIIDYQNSTDLRRDAENVCQLYTSLSTNNDNTYQAYSDSYPFYLNGYKAIFFITDADDPNYHTTSDLVSNCNFDFCREVTKISCALLYKSNK